MILPALTRSGLEARKGDFYQSTLPNARTRNLKYGTACILKSRGRTTLVRKTGCLLVGKVVTKLGPVSSVEVAEATKLLENIFRSVNIALVNEMKVLFEKMGFNVWEVINAAKTKPFGYMPFYPGPGLGGHCIPIDPFYLTWKAREYDFNTRFIELAGEVNTRMPYHVVDRLADGLSRQETLVQVKSVVGRIKTWTTSESPGYASCG